MGSNKNQEPSTTRQKHIPYVMVLKGVFVNTRYLENQQKEVNF